VLVALASLAGLPAFAGPTYTLFTDPPGGSGTTVRFGINDAGDYVGSYLNSGLYYGFMHTASGFSSITGSHPTGINSSNDVTGYTWATSGYQGFIVQSGVYSPLQHPGSSSTVAYGINGSDEVVGYYVDGSGVTHGFTETAGVYSDVDVPGAVATYVLGVNDAGDLVGSYFDGTDTHAFVDRGGSISIIDYPGAVSTYAASINTAGDIVGWYTTCAGCAQIGFIRNAGGDYTSIAPLPGIPTYLTGINDSDQIMVAVLGGSYNPGIFGTNFGFLLGDGFTPTPVPKIPEPGTQALMAAGGLVLLALGRLRRRLS